MMLVKGVIAFVRTSLKFQVAIFSLALKRTRICACDCLSVEVQCPCQTPCSLDVSRLTFVLWWRALFRNRYSVALYVAWTLLREEYNDLDW